MSGETHAVIGVASAVLVMQPQTPSQFAICSLFGLIGGLAPDVDVKQSKGAKGLKKLIAAVTGVILLFIFEVATGNDYIRNLLTKMNIFSIAAFLILLALLSYGYTTPHRMVTHSFEYAAACSACVFIISKICGIAFLSGYLMHIFVDIYNKKPVKVSLILNWEVYLNLVPASGKANLVCLSLGSAIVMTYVMINVPSILL